MNSQTMDTDSTWVSVPVCPDDAFEAISNARRRICILSLARAQDPVSAGDLAVEIAAIENEIQPAAVDGKQRTAAYVALIQSHLPKLDDLGVVDFDERSKRTTPTAATKPLARVVEFVEGACYEVDADGDSDD